MAMENTVMVVMAAHECKQPNAMIDQQVSGYLLETLGFHQKYQVIKSSLCLRVDYLLDQAF